MIQDCYKDENGNYVDILKIGYSDKSFMKSRNNQYRTHNYGYKFIGEREGSTELETQLHKKFKSFLLPNSKEWFYYSQDIIDGFNAIQLCSPCEFEEIDKITMVEWLRDDLLHAVPNYSELYEKHKEEIEKELYNYTKDDNEIKEGLRLFKSSLKKNCTFITRWFSSVDLLLTPFINTLPEKINISSDLSILEYKCLREDIFRDRILDLYKPEIKEIYSLLKKDKEVKLSDTLVLLNGYKCLTTRQKEGWIRKVATDKNLYRYNYIGTSKYSGGTILNYLVMVADQRAFYISYEEYLGDSELEKIQLPSLDQIIY